jgi:O-antigen/teichoic acid export membrane protein
MTDTSFLRAIFQRIAKNIGWGLSGQAGGALLGIAYLAIAARAVGAEGLGLIAIAVAYMRIMNRLFRLEPWQTAIRYGIGPLEAGETGRFKQVIKFSILVDALSGVTASVAIVGVAWYIAPLLGAPPTASEFLAILALAALFEFRSTGIAVLRMFDRFDLLAKADVAVAATRLALAALAFAFGYGLWAFLFITLFEAVANALLPLVIAQRQLRQRGYRGILRESLVGFRTSNPAVLRYLWNSNLNVMIRQTAQRLDVVILSLIVGVREVGYYHVARRLGDAAMKLSRPLMQAIFPEFARLWSSGNQAVLQRLVLRSTTIIGLVGLCLLIPIAVAMPGILVTFLGPDFGNASNVVVVQFGAMVIYMSGAVFQSALMSIGCDRQVIRVTLAGSVIFLLSLAPLVLATGIVGASIAHVLFNSIMTLGFYRMFRQVVRDRDTSQP